ncbi:TIGR01212 family radical SAM protein [Motiliproteus sp. MSK22-1]|uniref:TIGR01212 family radical SAM protein n=1 Tax=Motiliproteus sp. MSK22-1 TaxID=1897630 RepID=UPI0009787E9E|nr:TIGR01212 family radical SAM protein [Motiliproteus sp. MSK22-1]OMH36577.1 TIGR01212 family radical SAM protein [Motiliproteus sp. MSK22-1]
MHLDEHINGLGRDLKLRHGEKIHKLTINAPFTCPNRDGTLGRGGCTFCNNASFNGKTTSTLSIREQLEKSKPGMRAKRYLAYFQTYTNTYAEVKELQRLYEEALTTADIVGICVGTRPDCVPNAALDLLADYQQQGYEVWLELGLQSSFDKTLDRINRGHHFDAYVETVQRAHSRNLKICTHLIIGLPGEAPMDSMITLDRVIKVGCEGLKLHPLHIVKGSQMARQWKNGEIPAISQQDYAEVAAEMIQHTPWDVVYHRVSATARKPTLLAPEWCDNRWPILNDIARKLAAEGGQGSALTC